MFTSLATALHASILPLALSQMGVNTREISTSDWSAFSLEIVHGYLHRWSRVRIRAKQIVRGPFFLVIGEDRMTKRKLDVSKDGILWKFAKVPGKVIKKLCVVGWVSNSVLLRVFQCLSLAGNGFCLFELKNRSLNRKKRKIRVFAFDKVQKKTSFLNLKLTVWIILESSHWVHPAKDFQQAPTRSFQLQIRPNWICIRTRTRFPLVQKASFQN